MTRTLTLGASRLPQSASRSSRAWLGRGARARYMGTYVVNGIGGHSFPGSPLLIADG